MMNRHDYQATISYAKEEGIAIGEARGVAIGEARGVAIGEARGEARGVMQTALAMKSRGMSLDLIAEITGLRKSEIRRMKF
ncbi:MAG: hypothetical protein LBH25_01130 [Fibromonadaceae bacterium]|jgi:hypothetical protein|nr:hypothetical protein [Fibromonadaceae bacterium]